MNTTIKRNGANDSLTFTTTTGGGPNNTFDLSPMTPIQHHEVRKGVVNKWCIENGFAPLHYMEE